MLRKVTTSAWPQGRARGFRGRAGTQGTLELQEGAAEGTPDSYLHSYRTPLSCLSRRPACSEDGDDNEPGSKKRVRGLGGEGKAYTRHSLPAP